MHKNNERGDACLFGKIGLILNESKAEAIRLAEDAASFLTENGVETLRLERDSEDAGGADLILTFGGDGTFLAGARIAVKHDIPVLGINVGTVGFLTEEEPEQLQECLKSILAQKYRMEERAVLEVRNPQTGEMFTALNDTVVTRGGFARMIQVECTVDGELYSRIMADGIITATSTGSTGYSLSAGGPIVQPDMDCIVLAPVCAHTLQICPCIVDGKSRIRFRLNPDRRQIAELQIDGTDRGLLKSGDEVTITGSDRKLKLLRIHPYHFFTRLRSKLTEWGSE